MSKSTNPSPAPGAASGPSPGNPYLNARREWDERYGVMLTHARNWRLAAAAALTVAAISVAGVVYIGSQTKIQPFIIAVDDLGSPVAVAMPQAMVRATAVDERVIRAQIANFIFNSRSFSSDFAAQQVLFDRTFAMISSDLAPKLTEFFRDQRMPLRENSHTVEISVRTVINSGGDTWQVDWTETVRAPGASVRTENWRAIIQITADQELAARPDMFVWNPFGVFVRALQWQRVAA